MVDELAAQQIIVLTALVFPCKYIPPVPHTRCQSSANDASYNPDHWPFRHFSPFVLRNPRIDLRPKDIRMRFEDLAAVSRVLEYYLKISHDHRLRGPYHFIVQAILVFEPIQCTVPR